MTTNLISNDNTTTTNETNTAIRVTRALIGLSMLVPVIAISGITPWIAFGLSMAGSCMIFTSFISRTSVGGVGGCAASFAIMGVMLATTSLMITPATVAILSLASIAIVALGLISSNLPATRKALPTINTIKAHITEVSDLTQSANDAQKIAA